MSGSPLPALASSGRQASKPHSLAPPCSSASLRPALSHALYRPLACHIHNDLLAVDDASLSPKLKETTPLVPGIEILADQSVSGRAGGEKRALINDALNGVRCARANRRHQRPWARGGG